LGWPAGPWTRESGDRVGRGEARAGFASSPKKARSASSGTPSHAGDPTLAGGGGGGGWGALLCTGVGSRFKKI